MILADLWRDTAADQDRPWLSVMGRLEGASHDAAPEDTVWLFIGWVDYANLMDYLHRHPSLVGRVGAIHAQLRQLPYPIVVTAGDEVAGRRE